jgi:antitoxin HicB
MAVRSFTVIYEPAEEGGYYAHVPALELTTEGETLEEAKEMARDAIAGYLEAARLIGKPIPYEME